MKRFAGAAAALALAASIGFVASSSAAPNETKPFKVKTATSSTVVNSGQLGSVSVNCPTNYPKVLGGGYDVNEIPSVSSPVVLTESKPVGGGAWTATVANNTGSNIRLTVYARCH